MRDLKKDENKKRDLKIKRGLNKRWGLKKISYSFLKVFFSKSFWQNEIRVL